MAKTYTEQCLETLIELVDIARKQQATGFEKTQAALDAVAVNLSQVAQQQRATAANIEALRQSIERQNAAIDGHLGVAQAQSVNIAELTRLATKLIDRAV